MKANRRNLLGLAAAATGLVQAPKARAQPHVPSGQLTPRPILLTVWIDGEVAHCDRYRWGDSPAVIRPGSNREMLIESETVFSVPGLGPVRKTDSQRVFGHSGGDVHIQYGPFAVVNA